MMSIEAASRINNEKIATQEPGIEYRVNWTCCSGLNLNMLAVTLISAGNGEHSDDINWFPQASLSHFPRAEAESKILK